MPLPDLDPVQLLAPDGTVVHHDRYAPLLVPEALVDAYRHMVVARRMDREYIALQRQGQLALYASCHGQEALQVATVLATESRDHLFPQYRELGAFVARGVDVASMAAYWAGRWHAADGFLPARVAPLCIPIATQALHAVGWAMGARFDRGDDVAIAFLGDGATSEGDAHEAFNFAAVYAAPCVFVVSNNQWAISVPVHEQTRAASLAHKAVGYGMPGVRVDGNDVVASHAVVSEAVARARAGDGPTLVEAVTYRMEAHTTADDPTRYRTRAEVDAWAARDPILRVRARLEALGALDDAGARAIDDEAESAAATTRAAAFDVPAGPATELFDHVYAVEPPSYARQRRQLGAELAAGPPPDVAPVDGGR